MTTEITFVNARIAELRDYLANHATKYREDHGPHQDQIRRINQFWDFAELDANRGHR